MHTFSPRVSRDLYRFHQTGVRLLDDRYRFDFGCKLCSYTLNTPEEKQCCTFSMKPVLLNGYMLLFGIRFHLTLRRCFVCKSNAWSIVNPHGLHETRLVVWPCVALITVEKSHLCCSMSARQQPEEAFKAAETLDYSPACTGVSFSEF